MKLRTSAVLLAGTAILATVRMPLAQELPQANDQYFQAAAADLEAALANQPLTGQARNVIIFVGDGMSVSTVTASRIYEGQSMGMDGESHDLTLDTFPWVGLSRTYGHDAQISDSAPTATAMVSGVKTNAGVIGLTGEVVNGDCSTQAGHEVTTIFEQAEDAGLATGIVSTARITHATPAATFANTVNRDWESSADEGCTDIATQLIRWDHGDGFEVVLGGGRSYFLPSTSADPEDEGAMGNRPDDVDLIAEWTGMGNDHVFVWNQEEFDAIDVAAGQHILGLFERSHMEYEADRADDVGGEPSIAEMTAMAIERLQQNENGFVLMVEGGRIDHAHHAGNAARALIDTVALDEAVQTALDMTNREDTLIIVTADHGHTMTINGYADRGNPILGLSMNGGVPALGGDGLPYTTLSYANGPGGVFPAVPSDAPDGAVGEAAGTREDLTTVDVESLDYIQQALVPMGSESHTGEEVPVYAWGPWAHLLARTVEQNMIYHVMSYALGLGERQ